MGANVVEKIYFTLGGIFLCIVAIISWLLLNKSGRKRGTNNNDEKDISCRFYINVFVLNKQEVIKEKVKSKFRNFKYLGNALAAVAGRMVTDEKFSNVLYDKLCVIIPEKLREELGVESSVELEYSNKSYFVISVDIKAADARFLVQKKGSEKYLRIYDNMISSLFGDILEQRLSDQLVGIIGEKLVEKIPEKIIERMKDGAGIDVEAVAKSEGEQARYFFAVINLIAKSNASTPEIMGQVSTSIPNNDTTNRDDDTNITYNGNGDDNDNDDGVYVTRKDSVPEAAIGEQKDGYSEKNRKKSGWFPGKYIQKFTKSNK